MKKIFVVKLLLIWLVSMTAQEVKIKSGTRLQMGHSTQLVLNNTDFELSGLLNCENSAQLVLTGSQDQTISLTWDTIPILNVNKNTNGKVYIVGDFSISHELRFNAADNFIYLGDYTMDLAAAAIISGADENHYLICDGTGKLEKFNPQNFTYPLGADQSTYNPITITENGTADRLAVRILDQALDQGTSGTPFSSDVVDATWLISETVAGGSDLDLSVQWDVTDELPGFDANDCGLAQYQSGSDWDLSPDSLGASSSNSRSITNVQPGTFVVSDDLLMNKLLLGIKIALQGPYNSGTGLMNDQIRAATNLPTNSPYTSGKFLPVGRGGGEVAGVNAFDANGDDSVVDWVMIWLRDANNPTTILQTKAGLLQKDGDIVDLDGISDLELPGDDGTYIVDVGHRNHLSIRTASSLSLTEAMMTNYDFTTAQSQAFGTNPMADLGGGTFGLYSGNASGNNNIRATGPPFLNDYTSLLLFLGSPTNIITGQYADEDINMDGTVRVTGPPFINDYSKLLNALGSPTTIISEQF